MFNSHHTHADSQCAMQHGNHTLAIAALEKMQALCGDKVRTLCADSRKICRNDIFVACQGLRVDGRDYINAALQAGAGGVFWDPDNFCWPENLNAPNVPIDNLSMQVGWLADAVYDSPSTQLSVLAITATNGKTTASHFVAQLLAAQNIACGMMGTLGTSIAFWQDNSAHIQFNDSSHVINTTPDAIAMHKHLRDFIRQGARAAVLEASSHGIAQGRLVGARLCAAALINIGRDHLDYHKTIEQYQKTKMRLLQTPNLQTAVLNAELATDCTIAHGAQLQTFGEKGEAMRLLDVTTHQQDGVNGQTITVDGICGRRQFLLPFAGRHNVDNFMAAALLAHAAGADWQAMHGEQLTLPRGRLQAIGDGAPAVFVDYAHTPDALQASLLALQDSKSEGRLWLVFGCGGERDSGKRAEMGKIAAALSDVVIITDDNPRHESASDIRADILGGVQNKQCEVREIGERSEAIATAINDADAKDIILIAGKGHEEYQDIAGTRLPFSDAEVATKQLALLAQGGRTC